MQRPSKQAIRDAVQKLKESNSSSGAPIPDQSAPPLESKKANKNRIRKKGV